LLGEARLHQEHARIGLGDQVSARRWVHALIHLDPQPAALIDDYGMDGAGEGSAKALSVEKKPDRYWSALWGAESSVISVVEIGLVRRSEISSSASTCVRT
jgi:hypothetical protein